MFFRAAAIAAAASLATAALADDKPGELRDARWVQWAFSMPPSVNPLSDITGQNCMVGQNGSTWFLAPSYAGSFSRSCTVPEGVKLQFMVSGGSYVYAPGYCGDVPGLSDRDLRAILAPFTDSLTVNVTLNGEHVRAKRIRSEAFPTALPADDLRPGVHTLQMVTSNTGDFNMNLVYTLTVMPRPRR